MNAQKIELVRNTFAALPLTVQQPAALFYDNLFAADPSLRKLFTGNMEEQGQRLLTMIGGALTLLDRPDTLKPVLRQLAVRHVGYGVKDEHYATVGASLIRTLEQGLGNAFPAEARDAWIELYGLISSTMMDAARDHAEVVA